jgi:quinol monooxygenase YgiN
MSIVREALPPFLAEPSRLGTEISITGKWVAAAPGSWFRKSPDSDEMRQEWEDIHADAAADPGILSTEINYAVGEDAVLVHHVFKDADAVLHYFSDTAARHMGALTRVARPELHLVRGISVPTEVQQAILAKAPTAVFGELLYGYVKDDYQRPDLGKAIMVTAKWTCSPSEASNLNELEHWWQQVGTVAHSLEEGLLRFEVYRVPGEDALIVHETFQDTAQLRFHLTRGTAARFKKELDQIAAPECYYFRGPVSWDIRTYSKFMHLPATYTSQGALSTSPGGSMSEGTTA